MDNTPFQVRGYGRSSTDKQVISIEQQEAAVCDAFHLYQRVKPGWSLATWGGFFFDEATSRDSRFRQREVGSLVLAASQPGDCIMAAKFDRIFASTLDVCETIALIPDRRLRLSILDLDMDLSSELGQCVFKIMSAVKELEVQEIRRRGRNSIAHRKKVGLPHTLYPIGWKGVGAQIRGAVRKFFVPDEEERALARALLDLKRRLHLTNVETAEIAYQRGLKNPDYRSIQGRWTKPSIARWLTAARRDFPLPNGEHVPYPIPPEATPVATFTPED